MLACALLPVAGGVLLTRLVLAQDFARLAPIADAAARQAALAAALGEATALWGLAAVFGASIAVLFAVLLAPSMTRPVSEVAAAVERIALGTRSIKLDTQAGGEAGKLVQAFNRMARNLDAAEDRLRRAERLAAWRDIARQMAHEIKNPLTPIQMAVEMLRKARARNLPDFDQLFDEETRIVLEEVARLRRLVENFSRFARAPKPRPEPLHLEDVVAHVVGLHAGASGAEVTGEAEDHLPVVRADREQLTQVLMNLVANACFAAEERARNVGGGAIAAVHVSARDLHDGRVAFAVEDNGAGIDPSVLARLFEPYVTTRAGAGGTGLGLAVVERIVHEHGGSVTAETSPEGTRFEVVLPVQGPPATEVTLDSQDRPLRAS
jgi:nitrogen fixation/metabolism regulation signal transduction histidine kinase